MKVAKATKIKRPAENPQKKAFFGSVGIVISRYAVRTDANKATLEKRRSLDSFFMNNRMERLWNYFLNGLRAINWI